MAGEQPEASGDGTVDAATSPPTIEAPARLDFPVAGVGASAGGLPPLEELLARLSAPGMAIVVVQHLAPSRESLLSDILASRTPMPVLTLRDGMALTPGRVYVAPPGVEVTVEGTAFRVASLRPGEAPIPIPRHPIDRFLRSLAEAVGPRAMGVILSGTGSDGTLGLRAIKEAHGITFAQDPATAEHADMPESAINAGAADFCLPPSQIGAELVRLAEHPVTAPPSRPRLTDMESTQRIFALLRASFGVDFSRYKQGTMERRIERRMALRRIARIDEYVRFLEEDVGEQSTLLSDLLVGVTSFFRDGGAFEALKTVVFPRLLEAPRADAPFRAWVAGASTGEEAYSLAMCLAEYLGDRASGHKIQIFCTDLDETALSRARRGVYPASIEQDLSTERLQRFFTRCEDGYRVHRQIRDMVVCARHNLVEDPPFSHLDLVSCRNVLIYMQAELQRRILGAFHYALSPGGFLLLGASESVGAAIDLFTLVDRRLKLYVKRGVASAEVALGRARAAVARVGTHTAAEPAPSPPLGPRELADRAVIERYGPPGVVVDDAMQILQFRGKTGPYLAPQPGDASLDLLKLARDEIRADVRAAVHRANSEDRPITTDPVWIRDESGRRGLIIDVLPLHDGAADARCLLVVFREVEDVVAPDVAASAADTRVLALEQTLAETKDHLQATIDALEAANDKLVSTNEDLSSSNEQLQTTNEELTSSKEELQSTNEELGTVNEELYERMDQLDTVNDDLSNVLEHAGSPVVLVDMGRAIRRFSAAAAKALGLLAADVGRPVAYLDNVLPGAAVERAASEAIDKLRTARVPVQGIDGTRHVMKVVPYRTAERAVRGALIMLEPAPPASVSPGAPARGARGGSAEG